jgi:hypothetical protein
MNRSTLIWIILAMCVAAGAAIWFWALRPLGFVSYLSSTGTSEAEIIRRYWPHRLVQPEWVSASSDRIMNWHFAEAVTRLIAVSVVWCLALAAGVAAYAMSKNRRANHQTQ